MKGTIVLLAGTDAENYGRRIMYKAHAAGNLGFEMARLPQHVSLKQPFTIPNLSEFEAFFDSFAKEIKPINLQFEEINLYPSNTLGAVPSGCLSIRVKKNDILDALQKELFRQLEIKFGSCPAEHDDDYIFHMTVAIGGAPFSNYEIAYQNLQKFDYENEFLFDKLGLFYYDDDNYKPGTYFCYKILELFN